MGPPKPPTSPVVLIVDDEPSVLTVVETILFRAGYKTLTATNGMHALDALGAHCRINLVLTDVRMPRMDGVELARYITRHRPRVPIMFMAAQPAFEVETFLTAESGINREAILRKPFTASKLVFAVGNVLQRSESDSFGPFWANPVRNELAPGFRRARREMQAVTGEAAGG